MSATRTSSVASNFACETLLSKSSDSTTGIPNVSGGTDLNKASAYVVNAGNDRFPVIQGVATFDGAPVVPAGLIQGTLAVTAQAAGTSATISQIFPADANGTYLLDFTCSSPGQGLNMSAVGRIVKSGATIDELSGFTGTAVQAALAGGAVSLIAFQRVIGSPSVIQMRNDANAPITGTINLYKIASSN
jgi:hypothetical protein